MRPSEKAWLAIAIGVIAYDATAKEGETLSEGVDQWLIKHPTLTRLAILAVAHHLTNDLHPRADPIGLAFIAVRRIRRRGKSVAITVEV